MSPGTCRTISDNSSGGLPDGAALVDLKACLERTEAELFDVNNTLKHKVSMCIHCRWLCADPILSPTGEGADGAEGAA